MHAYIRDDELVVVKKDTSRVDWVDDSSIVSHSPDAGVGSIAEASGSEDSHLYVG